MAFQIFKEQIFDWLSSSNCGFGVLLTACVTFGDFYKFVKTDSIYESYFLVGIFGFHYRMDMF